MEKLLAERETTEGSKEVCLFYYLFVCLFINFNVNLLLYLQESFNNKVDQLAKEKQIMQQEMQSLSETIADLEKQNQEKDAQLSRYSDDKNVLKHSIEELNSKNNLLEEQKDTLQRQLNSYSNERIALQGDLSALNETVQNLEREREVCIIRRHFTWPIISCLVISVFVLKLEPLF